MARGRPKGSGKTGTSAKPLKLRCIDRKPIRPLERQRMRPWLMNLLEKGTCRQLAWFEKRQKTFRVSWKHAAGQTFDPLADATLFELWAQHTGKYYPGDIPDPKKWKANFRCALHSLQDVHEAKELGVKKGDSAYRVYRFLDDKVPKKPIIKKAAKTNDVDDDESDDDYSRFKNPGTKSRPRKMDDLDSEGSERGYSSPEHESSHSDWEMMEVRGHEETEAQRSPLPNFDQLCESAFHLGQSEEDTGYAVVKEEPQTPEMTPETMTMAADKLVYFDAGEDVVSFIGEGHIVDVDITSESIFDLQEEEVTTADHDHVIGPSVIVIEEQGGYSEFMNYTSLENVPY